MKIEMGEQLIYSWMRHILGCQIVQTNWKVSSSWDRTNNELIDSFILDTDKYFSEKHGYSIYKKTSSVAQLIQQAECDVIGVQLNDAGYRIFAADVAFHEAGLNYGSKQETVERVVKKTLRTAMCLYGYLGVTAGEIAFASPKINKAVVAELGPCIAEMNGLFVAHNLGFEAKIYANEDFMKQILTPVLDIAELVADTGELFLRGYQLQQMFKNSLKSDETERFNEMTLTIRPSAADSTATTRKTTTCSSRSFSTPASRSYDDPYPTLKVGELAQGPLAKALRSGCASEEEVSGFLLSGYSKAKLGLDYPLLVEEGTNFDRRRYYLKFTVVIREKRYHVCSQWFETPANNDRPLLIKWLKAHGVC